jgi:hypothetical protein
MYSFEGSNFCWKCYEHMKCVHEYKIEPNPQIIAHLTGSKYGSCNSESLKVAFSCTQIMMYNQAIRKCVYFLTYSFSPTRNDTATWNTHLSFLHVSEYILRFIQNNTHTFSCKAYLCTTLGTKAIMQLHIPKSYFFNYYDKYYLNSKRRLGPEYCSCVFLLAQRVVKRWLDDVDPW